LQEEIEGLQNQLELAKSEKLQAESDLMILTMELENDIRQLLTVRHKSFKYLLCAFEEAVEKSEETHHLELESARLKLKIAQQNLEIAQLKLEYAQLKLEEVRNCLTVIYDF
jgi:hypothetical protein